MSMYQVFLRNRAAVLDAMQRYPSLSVLTATILVSDPYSWD